MNLIINYRLPTRASNHYGKCGVDFIKSTYSTQFQTRPARGGGGKVPGARTAKRAPGNLGKMFVLFIIAIYMFVLNEIRLLAHYPLIVVK
jgi:hypothetical protein